MGNCGLRGLHEAWDSWGATKEKVATGVLWRRGKEAVGSISGTARVAATRCRQSASGNSDAHACMRACMRA
eukprot:95762-Chlamydomonas_euryale.AAC.2